MCIFSPASWRVQEDALLLAKVEVHGLNQWSLVASAIPGRKSKQCSERYGAECGYLHNFHSDYESLCLQNQSYRYKHHLRPDITKHSWTRYEDLALVTGQYLIGNKWTEMYVHLKNHNKSSYLSLIACTHLYLIASLFNLTMYILFGNLIFECCYFLSGTEPKSFPEGAIRKFMFSSCCSCKMMCSVKLV